MAESEAGGRLVFARTDRRGFLRLAGLAGLSYGGVHLLAACAPAMPVEQTPAAEGQTAAPEAEAASGPKHGGILTIALNAEPTGGFDPHLSSHLLSQHHFELVYEQLLRTNSDGSLSPGLAESYEIIDDLTYEFKLRPGVLWHSGREVTAEDVKFSFERQADPDTASMNQAIYGTMLDRVEIVDPLTVRIITKEPYAPMLSFIAAPREGNIVPADAVMENGDLKTVMIGTGPYKFIEYTPGNEARFERNPDYWEGDLPYLDGVVFKYITDDEARLAALLSGAVDFAYFGAASVIEPYLEDERFTWALTKPLVTRHLVLNNKVPPLDNPLVRQAISLAINRQEMIDVNLLGYGQVSTHIPPADTFWTFQDLSSLSTYEQDLDRARQLLAEAGVTDLTLQLKTGPNPVYVTDAEMIQSYLGNIGITVEIIQEEQAAWVDDFWKVNHESLLMGYQSFVDPDAFYRVMHSESTASWTNINDPRIDDLLERGRTEMDRDARREIYWELQRILAEDSHEIILYSQIWAFEGMHTFVKDYFPMSITLSRAPQLRVVWLDQ